MEDNYDHHHHRLGLVFFPAFDWSISPDHPEREERLLYTRDQLVEEGLLDLPNIIEYRPEVATEIDIKRVHVCIPTVHKVVTKPHLIAAGGSIVAAESVIKKETGKAIALVRPPGHHAMRIVHGARGFCTINNEAICIEYLRKKYGSHLRIAVIDTDAHHADGTQDIFYNDPDILHISLHQDGRTLYPGTGGLYELGGPGAYGLTLNVPLPPGSGDNEILYVTENLILPVLKEFKPDLIINAAGQDNHYTDPLTNMRVTAGGYGELTRLLKPDIVVLEGGYSIEGALPYVNLAIILALAGMDYSHVQEPDWHGGLSLTPGCFSPSDVPELVKKEVDFLLDVWGNRNHVDLNEVFGSEKYYRRQRQIYFDTDDINEEQTEKIRRCGACSGFREIYSLARKWNEHQSETAIVHIPWRACAGCRREAEMAYDRLTSDGKFDFIYLQDVEGDIFLAKEKSHI